MDNLNIIAKYLEAIHQPSGNMDSGGRWYPSDEETCSCCKDIRSPSRSYPWSFFKHCHSKKHIKNLLQENPTHLGKEIPEALTITKESAPLYINTESDLLKYVRDELLGIHKDSRKGVKHHADKTH